MDLRQDKEKKNKQKTQKNQTNKNNSSSACHKNISPSTARHYSAAWSTEVGVSLSCGWLQSWKRKSRRNSQI